MSRNFAAAYETGYFPMIHCGTSFGHYKEIREQLVHHKELRDDVRRILDKMGKPLVILKRSFIIVSGSMPCETESPSANSWI